MNDIRGVIALDPDADARPPIVLTEALRGEGIDALWSALVERRDALAAAGELERAPARQPRRRGGRGRDRACPGADRAGDRGRLRRSPSSSPSVQRREVDPLTAADRIVAAVLAGGDRRDAADARRPRRRPRAARGRLAGHPGALVGDARRPRRPRRHAQGREPPADGLVQDPGRLQHDRAADASRSASAGVVTASAGNHGQAVAWAARRAGIAATIFVPEGAPMAKVDAARGYGATVVLGGEGFDDAVAAATRPRRGDGRDLRARVRRPARGRRPGDARARARRAAAGRARGRS